MSFTLEANSQKFSIDPIVLACRLANTTAAKETPKIWEFFEGQKIRAQDAFNQLQPQVLATDDKNLISLFRRAVQNHDACHPEDRADPIRIYNRHYDTPPFLIPSIDLTFDIRETEVLVTTVLLVQRVKNDAVLVLDAENQKVLHVAVNDKRLDKGSYRFTKNELLIFDLPTTEKFEVTIFSSIDPYNNKSLQGMYRSRNWLTTQCEAESARKIFPTLDRPDVLSSYTTTIIADAEKYPYRLSNGNLIGETTEEDGRKKIVWEDPFPKPSYLFALIMGDFGVVCDTYTTRSGRRVSLEVFMEEGKEHRATYSLFALKKAMWYDESHFNREYDLDSLKMVAIPDFNSGAMENKGLITFNERLLLVDPECGTDNQFFRVAEVISHEYCHNWSGNRVTVRNWFELALKEAFTDFRSSLFVQWLFGEELVRPQEASQLRENQFQDDAKPSAHPIQVDSYISSDEIYDATTYDKGREVFRMLKTILDAHAPNGFVTAQDAYFSLYDGRAVTFRELLSTLQSVSGINLGQFERWFHQPGTPTVSVSMEYTPTKQVQLTFKQNCPHPKTQVEQEPFHIPLYVELLDEQGHVLVAKHLIELTEREQSIDFENIGSCPIPVFHHGFCAPIHLHYNYSNLELALIHLNAKDAFASKEAGEIYIKRVLNTGYESMKETQTMVIPDDFIAHMRALLRSETASIALKAEALDLPTLRAIVETDSTYYFDAAKKARDTLQTSLAMALENELLSIIRNTSEPSYDPTAEQFSDGMAIRKLKNMCYGYLALIPGGKYTNFIFDAYQQTTNFNNQIALLEIICEIDDDRRGVVLDAFLEKWKDDSMVLNSWIALQTNATNCTVERLEQIYNSRFFLRENPNHMRRLMLTFGRNLAAYHSQPERNYVYMTEHILRYSLINPKVASFYLAETAFEDFAKLPEPNKSIMQEQLERLTAPHVDNSVRSVALKYLETT